MNNEELGPRRRLARRLLDGNDHDYGAALKQQTRLSMVDGLSALAQYTSSITGLAEDDPTFRSQASVAGPLTSFAPVSRPRPSFSTPQRRGSVGHVLGAPLRRRRPGSTVYYARGTPKEDQQRQRDVDWNNPDGKGVTVDHLRAGRDRRRLPDRVVRMDGPTASRRLGHLPPTARTSRPGRCRTRCRTSYAGSNPVRRVELVHVTDLRPARHRRRHRPVQPDKSLLLATPARSERWSA